LNLNYTYKEIASLFDVSTDDETIIGAVAFDSRKLFVAKSVLFFALDGVFRDGHDYIKDAYEKGVRHFVVSKSGYTEDYVDAYEILVDNTLEAIQFFAKHHRSKFSCEVVAITGSNGKTTVKEWLSHLLNKQFIVAKSPKSYNSKLGVALSLLEITPSTEVAIIEVGISGPGEMKKLIDIIQPTHGILTSFGSGHRELFSSADEHFAEKIALFDQLDNFFYPELLVDRRPGKGSLVKENDFEHFLKGFPYYGSINKQNAQLCIAMAKELGLDDASILEGISEVNALTLRMETFDGVNDNTIINDTYSLDEDSLRHSLEYQLSNTNGSFVNKVFLTNESVLLLLSVSLKSPQTLM
jgi:alanine racemase